MDVPAIRKLTVLDRDGVPKPVAGGSGSRITGAVRLAAGPGIALAAEADAITLAVSGATADQADPAYLQKWRDIVDGNPPFTGMPYYVAKVNSKGPLPDGTMFLLGDLCSQLGLFPAGGADLAVPYQLELYDLCQACLDCQDYQYLFTYIRAIEEYVDKNKDDNLTTGLRLFKQYQATVHYWNYLVHTQSLVFTTAPTTNRQIQVKLGYRCLGCGPYDDVTVRLRVVQTAGPLWEDGKFILRGLALEPQNLFARVYLDYPGASSSSSTGSLDEDGCLLYIKEIDKTQWAVADLRYDTGIPDNSSSSQSSGAESSAGDEFNTYQLTATWHNTHLGIDVSRTHEVKMRV